MSRKFERQKIFLSFKDNTWGADLANTQLVSKCNKGFQFLLWVVPLKDKKRCCN